MAAGGYKEFVAGETLDEDEINDYLMQGVLVFAGTAARGSAIATPVEGQFSFLKDSDTLQFYDGSAWVEFSTSPGAAVVSGTTGSPTLGTVSSGGTTFNVYSFTGSGSITFSDAGFAELLVIGGGGSGGVGRGGGGGAGGHVAVSQGYFPVGTATVVVGAGGASVASLSDYGITGISGNTSRIGDFYSPGGGGGGGISLQSPSLASRSTPGSNGGSGGGASGFSTGATLTAGNGLSPIGNNGGTANGLSGGGGGGASAVGANAPSATVGGDGGAGAASSITGTSVTRAGGGGGGASTPGSGGTGGGGAAGNPTGTNGVANTGGGGGGTLATNTNTSGAGGSGIVIVRVAV